jgi:hypothetical protein
MRRGVLCCANGCAKRLDTGKDFDKTDWSGKSGINPTACERIRDRAAAMTFDGEAEFFLAASAPQRTKGRMADPGIC